MTDWRCRRCGSYVFFEPGEWGGRCECTESPSPWEPVERPVANIVATIILVGFSAAAIWWLGVG